MESASGYGGFDLQGPIQSLHQHQHLRPGSSVAHPTIHENFPLTIANHHDCDHTASQMNHNKRDRGKSGSDDDEECDAKKALPWHRVKWTDIMVKLLITAVSYIGEEVGCRRKWSNLQKKGKWKSISKVMAERGHFVSPQQCEDKFNDLNKRYKRLNEILGRGTSCEVVENPTLLEAMDHISEKGKEEVRKILSSKHLHYEEMCSYHNGNRLHLPPDPDLQRSLRLALTPRDDHDEVEEETEFEDHQEFSFGNSMNLLDCNKGFGFQVENDGGDVNQVSIEGKKTTTPQKDWESLQLGEKRLRIQAETLELEKERFKWQRFCQKKDQELEMMKMENERMKLENEHMALEIKQKELGIENN